MPPAIASEIRWGTGFDNVVHFDPMPPDPATELPQGLDDVVTWDDPAPGSRRVRNDAGVTDAWERNTDYKLAGRARYFDRASLAGLQAFLRNAGRGNTFRFIPDRRYPSFYVDSCYLDTPYDERRPQSEQADGSKSIDLVIRQQAFDFGLARRGLMFEYTPESSITEPSSMLATFTRATIAKYHSRALSVAEAASGVLRPAHFIGTRRTTLLERASTNEILRAEELDNVAWAKTNITIGSNAIVAPDGTTSAENVAATASAATSMTQNITATAPAYTYSIYVKKGVGSGGNYANRFGIRNATTATDLNFVQVNFDAGTLTQLIGSGGIIEALGSGWFRISLPVTSGISVGNTLTAYAGFSGGGFTAGDNVYAWGADMEPLQYPTSYIKTVGAALPRNADALQLPWSFVPQTMTAYLKFRERGTIFENSARVLQLSNSADPAFIIYHSSLNVYRGQHNNGISSVNSQLPVGPSYDNTVELHVVLAADGSVASSQSLNGAAASTAATSAALAFAPAWGSAHICIGGVSGGFGTNAFEIVRMAPGVRTLAEMRAA